MPISDEASEPTQARSATNVPLTIIDKNTTHRISALYPDLAAANNVRDILLRSGFAPTAIEIRHSAATDEHHVDDSDGVIKEVIVDGAIGAAVGVGLGALGTVVLIATSATLFIASPLIAPLALMGNLATVGGLLGGAFGAAEKPTHLSEILNHALVAGNTVLWVKTENAQEHTLAKKIITDSLEGENQIPQNINSF